MISKWGFAGAPVTKLALLRPQSIPSGIAACRREIEKGYQDFFTGEICGVQLKRPNAYRSRHGDDT